MNHSLVSAGSNPRSSAKEPSIISRWMWCAHPCSCTPEITDDRQLASIASASSSQNASGTGFVAPSALRCT